MLIVDKASLFRVSGARQEHDYIQDTKHDALLALVNEMRIELALNSQLIESLQ